MTTNQATVTFIRQVMADGKLTENEIISLATYLNENRDARKSWPGSAVFEVLRDIFADGRVEGFEIDGLGRILQGIEIICAGNSGADTTVTQVPIAPESAADDFQLPEIDQKVTISATNQFDTSHTVSLKKHKCDCSDWQQLRAKMPVRSPGRMCKHLVKGFEIAAETDKAVSKECGELFLGLIKVSADTDRGLEAVDNWKLLAQDETAFLVAWSANSEWCNVYAESDNGRLERFGYHVSNKRWSFGARPPKSGMLKDFFQKTF